MNDNKIASIELELQGLLDSDQRNWVKIYSLIHEVDTNQLWKDNYKSFTQWIRHLAELCRVHESLIWARNKAGKVYYEYQTRMKERNIEVKDISEISISPDNLVLVEKISQGNQSVQDDLIDKVIKKELTRADLKNAWATVRAEKEAKGESAVRKNSHQSFDSLTKDSSSGTSNTIESSISASDIVLAVQTDRGWVNASNLNSYIRHVYEVMTEFAVRPGTSRHARRIDALVLENLNCQSADEINLHGIEIKVSKSDLLNDQKTSEYEEFVDFLYIAVPEELADLAQTVAKSKWGILTISEEKVKVIRKPELNKAIFRDKTLAAALVKKLRIL